MGRSTLVMVLVTASGACGGGDDDALPASANPLGYTTDVLPYPSSIFEADDPGSPTGVRVDVEQGACPGPIDGEAFDVSLINGRTGWPAATTIIWTAPNGVDGTLLAGPADIAATLTDSSTVLFDLDAHARVPHFAEVDANEMTNVARQAIYLHPAARLTGGHHYAVAIRTTLLDPAGGAIPRPAAFQAVLDGKPTGSARLDARSAQLLDTVAALESAGISRDDLVVAWDFTVADDHAAIADGVAARDAILAAAGDLGANVTFSITSDAGTINADPRIARRIEFDYQVPSISGPKFAGFHRDGAGAIVAEGTETAHGYLMVPPCATAANKAGIVIFGHGFFGSLDEIRDAEHLRQLSADGCLVIAGTEWTGMARDDEANALLALNDLGVGFHFGERIWQGMANQLVLAQLLRGRLATDVLVDNANKSVVDPTRLTFYGISNGHILGSTFAAYDPFISRAALNVGGANWSLMFERSKNWAAFGAPLKGAYDDLLKAVEMEQVLEMALDCVDGSNVTTAAVPGVPAKHYLMQTSRDDAQVPNVSSFYQARSLGVTLLSPSVVVPFGFETAQATTTTGNAWTIFDEHAMPKPPDSNLTFAFDNNAHNGPRNRAAARAQVLQFFATGSVDAACGADVCDCTTGSCGALLAPMFGGN